MDSDTEIQQQALHEGAKHSTTTHGSGATNHMQTVRVSQGQSGGHFPLQSPDMTGSPPARELSESPARELERLSQASKEVIALDSLNPCPHRADLVSKADNRSTGPIQAAKKVLPKETNHGPRDSSTKEHQKLLPEADREDPVMSPSPLPKALLGPGRPAPRRKVSQAFVQDKKDTLAANPGMAKRSSSGDDVWSPKRAKSDSVAGERTQKDEALSQCLQDQPCQDFADLLRADLASTNIDPTSQWSDLDDRVLKQSLKDNPAVNELWAIMQQRFSATPPELFRFGLWLDRSAEYETQTSSLTTTVNDDKGSLFEVTNPYFEADETSLLTELACHPLWGPNLDIMRYVLMRAVQCRVTEHDEPLLPVQRLDEELFGDLDHSPPQEKSTRRL